MTCPLARALPTNTRCISQPGWFSKGNSFSWTYVFLVFFRFGFLRRCIYRRLAQYSDNVRGIPHKDSSRRFLSLAEFRASETKRCPRFCFSLGRIQPRTFLLFLFFPNTPLSPTGMIISRRTMSDSLQNECPLALSNPSRFSNSLQSPCFLAPSQSV